MDNFNLIEFLAKNPLREADASDLEKSYKKDVPQFVDDLKQYAKDPKVSAVLKAGQADGDPNDDKLPYTQTSVKVGGLIPTQNEIDFNKSVLHILDDQFGSLSSILNGKANVGNPIVTYNGKWIIDGHHRWSQVLAANPNAKMDALDIKGNLPPEDVLKAVHGAIAATTGKVPSSSVGEGSMNVLSASDDAVRANLEKLINDPSNFPSKAEALWREKGFDSKEKIVNYIANNLKSIRQQGHIQKAPGRISMPQTDADGAIKDKLDALAKGDVNISPPFVTENIKKNMNNFNLKNFINENNLGAYSRMKEDTVSEQSAFVLAADAAKDAGKDEFEFPEGSGKMHKVKLKQDIPVEEGMGGEMAEILGAFLALVGAGKTALEAVKILGDEHGDISISSIKDAIKQYKASKKIGEELSDEEADKFHTKLDNLVHKTFGPSSDEKKMNELSDSEKEIQGFKDKALVGAGIGLTTLGVTTHEVVFDYNGTPETIAFRDSKEAAEQAKAKLEKTGMFSGKNLKVVPVGMNEDFDIGHEDDEPSMLKNKMYRASKLASMLFDKLDNYDDMRAEVDFPDWWQTKLSKAKDMLQSAYDYLDGEEGVAQADAMNEEIGMEYEYDDIVGPLMQNMVKMEKWVAQNASDDTEAVQLLQLASNAVENFDNYMAYGTEMNEGAEGEWPKSTTSKYSDEYEFRLVKVEPTYQGKPGRAKYEVIDLESGEVKGTQVYTSPNSLKLAAADLIKPQGGTQSTNLGEINLSDAL